MSGANYYISLRQLFESERKIRAISLVKFSQLDLDVIQTSLSKSSVDNNQNLDVTEFVKAYHLVSTPDPDVIDMNAIYYVTGALVKKELDLRKNCPKCLAILVSDVLTREEVMLNDNADYSVTLFTEKISRGGLLYPTELPFRVCVQSWKYFSFLQSKPVILHKFLANSDQPLLWTNIMNSVLGNDEHVVCFSCPDDHPFLLSIIRRFFMCLLKNLMKKLNSLQDESKQNNRKVKKTSIKMLICILCKTCSGHVCTYIFPFL